MAADIMKELKKLENSWQKAEARPQMEFQQIPDGQYPEVTCDKATLGYSKNGRLQVTWDMKVLSGAFKGQHVWTYSGITDQKSLEWLKTTFEALGAKMPKKLSNLPRFLESCVGKKCSITVKTKGEFTNVYINKLKKNAANGEDIDLEEDEDEL